MRPRKKYDQVDVIAAIIGVFIGLGVLIAPIVPDRFLGWVGAVVLLSMILVVTGVG